MKFSVIVVCLNAGDKLNMTISSIIEQSYMDYEILVKDGGSTDGSINELISDDRIRLVTKKDSSIYDAMNQAVNDARGDYYIFLNCGDIFENDKVLEDIANHINDEDIMYGDMRRRGQKEIIASPHQITDFTAYRNIPCHQVCFYKNTMFKNRGYDLAFPIRADYEHFLWCKYELGAKISYADVVVCVYEGDGFSETKDNEKKAIKEHKQITKKYIGKKCILYKFIMIITLQKLRKKIAESEKMSGVYQKLKGIIYGKRKA